MPIKIARVFKNFRGSPYDTFDLCVERDSRLKTTGKLHAEARSDKKRGSRKNAIVSL